MPDLPAGYLAPLRDERPVGLRRRPVKTGAEFWRIDANPPAEWTWTGFAIARHRFDPASGAFRTRYAGSSMVGTFRERYRATGFVIPSDHAGHRLVRLTAALPLRVLDLRTEKNLDALDLDDQISTGQHEKVWDTCHRLADAVSRWWDHLDGIVYRSRTTPETSTNLAFFAVDGFDIESQPLAARTDILTDLVLRHDFTVGWDIAAQ